MHSMVRRRTNSSLITSAELSASCGLTLSTIHYYTALGLLRVRERMGNKRAYDVREAKARLEEIRRMRQEGYSLAIIRQRLVGG